MHLCGRPAPKIQSPRACKGCYSGQVVRALLANPLGPLQKSSLDTALYRSMLGFSPVLQSSSILP